MSEWLGSPRPQGQPSPYAGPPSYGSGAPPAPSRGSRPPCPGPVIAAMVLWIVVNAYMVGAACGFYHVMPFSYEPTGTNASIRTAAFVIGCGAAGAAVDLRRGNDTTRIILTILGALQLLALFTVPLIIVALILQYLPASNAWFRAVKAQRNPPRPPMPPSPPPA